MFSMSALITQLVAVFLNPSMYFMHSSQPKSLRYPRSFRRRCTLLFDVEHVLCCHMVSLFCRCQRFPLEVRLSFSRPALIPIAIYRSARLSILFSIIRITHTHQPNRILHAFGILFLLAWLILTAQLYWECETKTAWKHTEIPQCNLSVAVAICQLIGKLVRQYTIDLNCIESCLFSGYSFRQCALTCSHSVIHDYQGSKAALSRHDDFRYLHRDHHCVGRACRLHIPIQGGTYSHIGFHRGNSQTSPSNRY